MDEVRLREWFAQKIDEIASRGTQGLGAVSVLLVGVLSEDAIASREVNRAMQDAGMDLKEELSEWQRSRRHVAASGAKCIVLHGIFVFGGESGFMRCQLEESVDEKDPEPRDIDAELTEAVLCVHRSGASEHMSNAHLQLLAFWRKEKVIRVNMEELWESSGSAMQGMERPGQPC